MRKRILILTTIFATVAMILLILIWIRGRNLNQENVNEIEDREPTHALVIYFSLSANTKRAAEKIAAATHASLVRLEPVISYPKDYNDYVNVAENQLNHQIYPEIKMTLPDFSDDEVVYIGFPTWWHQPPMIIYSLFDKYYFEGKIIVPFTTSSSDPISKSMPYLQKLADKEGATLLKGYRYDGDDEALRKFLQQNN